MHKIAGMQNIENGVGMHKIVAAVPGINEKMPSQMDIAPWMDGSPG